MLRAALHCLGLLHKPCALYLLLSFSQFTEPLKQKSWATAGCYLYLPHGQNEAPLGFHLSKPKECLSCWQYNPIRDWLLWWPHACLWAHSSVNFHMERELTEDVPIELHSYSLASTIQPMRPGETFDQSRLYMSVFSYMYTTYMKLWKNKQNIFYTGMKTSVFALLPPQGWRSETWRSMITRKWGEYGVFQDPRTSLVTISFSVLAF